MFRDDLDALSAPMSVRSHAAPLGLSEGLGELGSEEQDQRGVVDPQQDGDERRGSPVAGGDAASADIVADQELAERERQPVTRAPVQTSRQASLTVGRILKIIANSRKRSPG
jgi:hypothetical protein